MFTGKFLFEYFNFLLETKEIHSFGVGAQYQNTFLPNSISCQYNAVNMLSQNHILVYVIRSSILGLHG